MNNKVCVQVLKLFKNFIRLLKNLKEKKLKIKNSETMQTTMANTNGQQLIANCASPPCTPSPCNSPINVTNLSDHSNQSATNQRISPINQITNNKITKPIATTQINTTSASNLLNSVVSLSSPLSASSSSSLSSSPSSSLHSPINNLDNSSNNILANSVLDAKFSTAELLIQQQANQQLNTLKNLTTQVKLRNGSTIKDEKNGKVSNFSIEAIMARDVENQNINIKSGKKTIFCLF